jgi:hypothetical protein
MVGQSGNWTERQDDITLIVAKCRADKSDNQMGLPYIHR